MAKNKVSEWSSTPANNTDIANIDIAEGCAPSGINNAIREMMAQVKDMQAGLDGDDFNVGGDLYVADDAVIADTLQVQNAVIINGTLRTDGMHYAIGGVTGNVTGNASGTSANVTGVVAIANGGTGLTSVGTNDQVLKSNGSAMTWGTISGTLVNIQYFTSSATYTPTTGTQYIIVEMVGGGGSGAVGSGAYGGAGGSAGGYARKKITSSFSGVTVTVGAGGGSGSGGGTSSFGSIVSATGGAYSAGSPGVGINGDLNLYGSWGMQTGEGGTNRGYDGGSSFFGGKGRGGYGEAGKAAGANSGSGGGGNMSSYSPAGAGGSGLVIVYEYA